MYMFPLFIFLFFVVYTCCLGEVQDGCKLPLEKGPCRARLWRYGYNTSTGKCTKFVYGGCQGNDNNFASLEQCRKECA